MYFDQKLKIILNINNTFLEVKISPDVPELTLTSGADLTLKCTGDVPVKWNINQYDSILLAEKVCILNNKNKLNLI